MRAKRLQTAQQRLNRFPYKYEAIDDAYARFLADAALPEQNDLAWRVLDRVLHARKPLPANTEALASSRRLYQPYGSTREMLFREACCKLEPARNLARFLLKAAVEAGYDLTDAELIGPELEPMDFASVGMQLLGWPRDFVRPEYLAQMDRALQRYAEERASRPRNDDRWDRDAGAALSAFMRRGVLPDARYFPFVMTTCEMFALNGHYFGRGGEELIAAFNAVATGTKAERAKALQRIGELQVQWGESRRAEAS